MLSSPESLGSVGIIVLLVVTLLNVFVLAYTVMAALGIDEVKGEVKTSSLQRQLNSVPLSSPLQRLAVHAPAIRTFRLVTRFACFNQRFYILYAAPIVFRHSTFFFLNSFFVEIVIRVVISPHCLHLRVVGTSSVYLAAMFALFGAGIPMYQHVNWLAGAGGSSSA